MQYHGYYGEHEQRRRRKLNGATRFDRRWQGRRYRVIALSPLRGTDTISARRKLR